MKSKPFRPSAAWEFWYIYDNSAMVVSSIRLSFAFLGKRQRWKPKLAAWTCSLFYLSNKPLHYFEIAAPFIEQTVTFAELATSFIEIAAPFIELVAPFIEIAASSIELVAPFIEIAAPFIEQTVTFIEITALFAETAAPFA